MYIQYGNIYLLTQYPPLACASLILWSHSAYTWDDFSQSTGRKTLFLFPKRKYETGEIWGLKMVVTCARSSSRLARELRLELIPRKHRGFFHNQTGKMKLMHMEELLRIPLQKLNRNWRSSLPHICTSSTGQKCFQIQSCPGGKRCFLYKLRWQQFATDPHSGNCSSMPEAGSF